MRAPRRGRTLEPVGGRRAFRRRCFRSRVHCVTETGAGRMSARNPRRPLLEVKGLRMHFPVTEGIVARRKVGEVKAVDGIDFTVRRGETLGLVGESGCGKTTTGRCILRLERPTGGAIIYDGVDIAAAGAQGPAGAAPAHPGGVPGPVQLAEPAHEGRRRSSASR